MVSKVSGRPSYRALGAALGLSHTAVRQLHNKRQMPIDSIAAARAWYAQNGHGRGGGRRAARVETGTETSAPRGASASAPADLPDLPDQGTLNRLLTAAKVRVTDLEAHQAQMDAQLRDGNLLKAEDVTAQISAASVALRDRLMALPAELALRIAAMKEPAEVADLLRKALKGVISDWFSALRIEGDS